jgi:DNA (cytosine-5)-methyltransferase 1
VKPRLLDLFCGAGGAAMGYDRAGFDVVGVDIKRQPRYPFSFVQGDALSPPVDLTAFDAIHASPPCQAWTRAQHRDDHSHLIEPVRRRLVEAGIPWVIENVPGAPVDGVLLCGADFGLPIIRHRVFETSWWIGLVPTACGGADPSSHRGFAPYARGNWRPKWRRSVMPAVWPWMGTLAEASEAIPPAYTEWIGRQLLARVR